MKIITIRKVCIKHIKNLNYWIEFNPKNKEVENEGGFSPEDIEFQRKLLEKYAIEKK